MIFVEIAVSLLISMLLVWLAFVAVLLITRPDGATMRDTARIAADTGRLVHRLARDRTLHRGVRLRLWLLLAYLASPIDLIPDFIPVVGYADDALITGLVLRSVIKRAGADEVRSHWPGTPEGLGALSRLCRLPALGDPGD
jgi:uncharacterized membrane protein YkvA (DUF1232 family)